MPLGDVRHLLLRAMRENLRVDGSFAVLGLGRRPAIKLLPYLPPFVLARYQDIKPPAPGSARRLSTADFERLSLAARIGLLQTLDAAETEQAANNAVAEPQTSTAKLTVKATAAKLDPNGFARIDVALINETLSWAANTLEQQQAGLIPNHRDATARQFIRGGLQIVGCRIVPGRTADVLRLTNAKLPFSVRLVGCIVECPILASNCELVTFDLSGSALVGLDATYLSAEGSVRLRRSTIFAPADFAGARIRGVFDATDSLIGPKCTVPSAQAVDADRGMLNLAQATIDNDVLMDRSRIWGGLSLRGAETRRSIFMNDAVLSSPVGILEAWAADDNLLPPPPPGHDVRPASQDTHQPYAQAIARESLHNPLRPWLAQPNADAAALDPALLADLETLPHIKWNTTQLEALLSQSMRARTSALRADGIKIAGSFFARGLKTNGRARLKYATISGGLHLDGSVLRSITVIGRQLDAMRAARNSVQAKRAAEIDEIDLLREATKATAQLSDSTLEDDFALDVRDASIAGNFSVGSFTSNEVRTAKAEAERSARQTIDRDERFGQLLDESLEREFAPTRVCGVITLAGAKVGGSAKFLRLRVHHAPKAADAFIEKTQGGEKSAAKDSPLIPYINLMRGREEAQRWAQIFYDLELSRSARTLDLSHTQIGDDVDIREARDVFGVDLEYANIGGNLKFCDKSGKPSPETTPTQPRQNNTTITCANRPYNLAGQVVFRNCRIRGDALLVFDPDYGPAISGELARVEGRLEIFPSRRAGQEPEGSPSEIDGAKALVTVWWRKFLHHSEYYLDRVNPKNAPRHAAAPLPFILQYPTEITTDKVGDTISLSWGRYRARVRQSRILRAVINGMAGWALPYEWAERPQGWYINLRNASSAVFCHPPEAWPNAGGLNIAGFNYKRTTDIGPLSPHPAAHENPISWQIAFFALTFLLIIESIVLLHHQMFHKATGPAWLTKNVCAARIFDELNRFVEKFGHINTWLVLYIIAFYAWLLIARLVPPRNGRSMPMAIEYFKLQQPTRNRYRINSRPHWALDPYVVGARALRDEGRNISANIIEWRRLSERTRMLSYRHHLLAKAGLRIVEVTSGFGFSLSRTILIIATLVVLTSGISHWFMQDHQLVWSDARREQSTQAGTLQTGAMPGSFELRSLLYAADEMVPFLDLGERAHWTAAQPAPCRSATGKSAPVRRDACTAEPTPGAAVLMLWPIALRSLGLALTTILAAALTTRASAALKRVEE